MSKSVPEVREIKTYQTFEEWVHDNVDRSVEFCNTCPFEYDQCDGNPDFRCPFRDYRFVSVKRMIELIAEIKKRAKWRKESKISTEIEMGAEVTRFRARQFVRLDDVLKILEAGL